MDEDKFALVDFPVDKYDLWTLFFGVIGIVAFFYILIQIGGLPGKIAQRRNHPHAEAVKYVGWIGLFTVFPYIHALIWSIHDSVTVDVRKMPKEGVPGEIDAPHPAALSPPVAEATATDTQQDNQGSQTSQQAEPDQKA